MKQPGKIAFLLIVLLFLSWLSVFHFVPLAYAQTITTFDVVSDAYDGLTEHVGAVYSTVHDAAVSDVSYTTIIQAGQMFEESLYSIMRSPIRFDTTLLPSDATILSAKLMLRGQYDISYQDFVIRIRKWTEASDGISTADYNGYDSTSYDDGLFNTSSFSTAASYGNNITISNFDLIQKAGYTDVFLISSRDLSSTAPDADAEYVDFEDTGGSYPPKLEVTTLSEEVPEYDYVDSQTNVDSSADKGTHSSFAAQKATDWINDTLTEANTNTTKMNDSENFVDNDSSDVDSLADKGSSSNFTAQQDSNVLFNDTLTEASSGGGVTNATYVNAVATSGTNPTSNSFSLPASWAAGDVGVFWWYATKGITLKTFTMGNNGLTIKYNVSSVDYGRLVICYRTLQTGDTTFAWTASSVSNIDVIWGTSVFRNVHNSSDPFEAVSGDPAGFLNVNDPDPPAATVATAGAGMFTMFGKANDYTSIAAPTNYVLCGSASITTGTDASAGAAYRLNRNTGSEDPPIFTLGGGLTGDDGYVWTGVLKPYSAVNYELNLEFQWTTVDYDETNEYICIHTGSTFDAENILVKYRNGGSWTLLTTMTTVSTWYNTSLALGSDTLTLQFLGGTESSDTSESTWQIECSLIHVWSVGVNYELQIEEEFTSCNYSRTNEELCIRMGTMNGETLSVQWWNATSSSWLTIIASLSANTWNNVSVTTYLTADTFYIRFLDGTTSGDGSQSTWDKDACLLHTWEGAGENHDPTNDACDSTATFSVNVDAWVNMTVSDQDLVADLYEVNINITTANSKIIILNWTQSTNTFAEVLDTDSVCSLNSSSSTRLNIDTDTDQICFYFKLSASVQKGNCNVTTTTTDDDSATDTDTYTNEFTIAFYTEISISTTTHHWTNATAGTVNQLIDENFVNFTVTANVLFKIQAKGGDNLVNGSYTIDLGNVTIHKDTLGSAVPLTTTYADVVGWTSQAMGENLELYVKLWLSVPSGSQPWLDYIYTLSIKVTEQ